MARGSIRKRGTNRWQLTYDVPPGPDGKRQQRYETVHGTKKQADARLTEIQHELSRGAHFDPTTMTVSEYLDVWKRDYADVSVRPRTLEGYHGIIETHLKPAFGSVKLADLGAHQVQAYYATRIRSGLSAQTVLHIHRLLSQTLKQAVRWQMLHRNVLEDISPPPRRRPEMRVLTPDEADALLRAAEHTEYHIPIHLALFTGMRRSEVLGLMWRDVDITARRLTVSRTMINLIGDSTHMNRPKSRRSARSLSFSEETTTLLSSHRQSQIAQYRALGSDINGVILPNTQLCARADGSIIRPNVLSRAFKRIAARVGTKGVRFHDLRHTHATFLLLAGVPIHVVQARLGHESIQTTVDTYGHLLPTSGAAAGEDLKNFVGRMWAGLDWDWIYRA